MLSNNFEIKNGAKAQPGRKHAEFDSRTAMDRLLPVAVDFTQLLGNKCKGVVLSTLGAPLLFLLFAINACNNNNSSGNEILNQDTIPVRIMPVRQDTLSPQFETSGYFTTDNETPFSFKNGGIIRKIYVREGDAIKKGQLLATVYAAEVQSAAQQAALAYEKARRDYRRAVHLYHDSVATLEQMQNAKTALGLAKQQQAAAVFNLEHSEIRALENGHVLKRYLHEGQMAGPGVPVLLVNSASDHGWIFKTGVSDYQWASLRIGDSAHLSTDAAPGIILKAVVFKKSEGVDPQTGAFTLQLSVKNSRGIPLASGLFGKATLFPSREVKGWHIPYDALLDGDEHNGFVFITNDKQHAQKTKVSISKIEHHTIVIDHGLENARYLIISGSAYLKDGSIIKVTE